MPHAIVCARERSGTGTGNDDEARAKEPKEGRFGSRTRRGGQGRKSPVSLSSTTASSVYHRFAARTGPDTHMASSSKSTAHHKDKRRDHRNVPEPITTEGPSQGSSSAPSKLDAVSKAILAPFTSRKHDSAKILTERACFRAYISHSRVLSREVVDVNCYSLVLGTLVHMHAYALPQWLLLS